MYDKIPPEFSVNYSFMAGVFIKNIKKQEQQGKMLEASNTKQINKTE